MLGKTQVLLGDSKGGEVKHHMAYLKKTYPVEETVEKIPDFKKFGRMAKLWLNPELVLNLKWVCGVTQVAAIDCVENSTQRTRLRWVIKLLI